MDSDLKLKLDDLKNICKDAKIVIENYLRTDINPDFFKLRNNTRIFLV